MDNYDDIDKDLGYEPVYSSWSTINIGLGSANWDGTERAEPSNSLGNDPNDPRPDQRVDVNAYQQWRRRQQRRVRGEMEAGFAEHNLILPS